MRPCLTHLTIHTLTLNRHRHLLNDLHLLLPHTRKDSKLDNKSSNNYNTTLNALADLHACNYVFLLEARKRGQDLYLWLAKVPNGPTIKFSVSNVHTMGELGFGGNCLRGGRGIVVFDKSFEEGIDVSSQYKSLVREMLAGVFCVPAKGVRGMKPFIDRVIGVYNLDGKIWLRCYEVREGEDGKIVAEKDSDATSLLEIGPRFVLTPIVILEGSFSGPVLFENKEFVSANQVRSATRMEKAKRYGRRRDEAEGRLVKKGSLGLSHGSMKRKAALDNAVLFR